MRILITGSNGMLGSDLVKALQGFELSGIGKAPNKHPGLEYLETDISIKENVSKAFAALKPAIVVHSAAYTDVDGCEKNKELAYSVNVKGAEHVAQAANRNGAVLIFISTDYVFDGSKREPYQEDDQPNSKSVYGRFKYEAEEILKKTSASVSIIRTSWLYGANGRNFFSSIMALASNKKELKVVSDQKGAPTYTKDLASGIKLFIERASRAKGCRIYHLANTGTGTWFEAAKLLLEKMSLNIPVKPISSAEWKQRKPDSAIRPANSVLNMSKIKNEFGIELRNWKDAFDEFWDEVLKQEWQNLVAR